MNELLKLIMNAKGISFYRGLLVIGMGYLIFSTKDFVSKEEYQADKREMKATLEKIIGIIDVNSRSIALLNEKIKVDQTQDRRIDDHEKRIRSMEFKKFGSNGIKAEPIAKQ